MLVDILDGDGAPRTVSWQGQDQIIDRSGALEAGAVGAAPVAQKIADASITRAGFLFQNTSGYAMVFQEATGVGGWVVNPGDYFPPFPGFPIPVTALYVKGSAGASEEGDTFSLREWVNAPD